jgi:hypothetical protein
MIQPLFAQDRRSETDHTFMVTLVKSDYQIMHVKIEPNVFLMIKKLFCRVRAKTMRRTAKVCVP